MRNLPKLILPIGIAVFFAFILISKMAVTIGSGEAGVLYKRFGGGVVTDLSLKEGFHLVAPWNSVFRYNVRQQEATESRMAVLSSNGLEITLDISAWYHPNKDELGLLHKTKGEDYLDKVIKPTIRSASRVVVGRYTPEQLYSTKRDAIQNEIYIETKKLLDDQHVELKKILVRDVTLPPAIKDAIERKLKQEQESLEYEFRLTKAKKEAERQKIEAEGKAAANRILSASLTDKVLADKGIEATLKLSESQNSKLIIIGNSKNGMPLILGGQ